MGVHTPPHPFNYLGLVQWGDIAEFTVYRNHNGKLVWYKKSYPIADPSDCQLAIRAAFAAAAAAWKALTAPQRQQWKLAAARASLCATGYNAYLHFKLTPNAEARATLASQTNTTLTL
jgi:acyl-CoA reductase-like NAD-dependent aldehyde dehydrogenase